MSVVNMPLAALPPSAFRTCDAGKLRPTPTPTPATRQKLVFAMKAKNNLNAKHREQPATPPTPVRAAGVSLAARPPSGAASATARSRLVDQLLREQDEAREANSAKPRVASATVRRRSRRSEADADDGGGSDDGVEVVEFVVSLAANNAAESPLEPAVCEQFAVCAWGADDSDTLLLQKLMAENPYPIPMPHVKLGKPGDLPGEGEYAEVQKQFQQVPRGKRVLQKENKGETLADIDQEFGIDDHDNENNNLLEDSIRVKVKSNLSKPRKRDSRGGEGLEEEEEEEVFDERDQPETESATPDDTWCSFWDPHSQDMGAQFRKSQTNRLLSARQQQQSIPRMTPRQRRQTLLALEKSLRPVSGLAPKASYVQHTPMTFAKAYPISSTPPGSLSNRDYETHNNLLHQSLANSNMIVTKKYTSREEYGELRPATASERVKAARDASNTAGGGGSSTSKPPQASTDDSDHWNYLKQRRSVTSVTSLSQQQQQQRPPSCSIRSSLVNSSTNMIPTHPQNYQLDPIRLSRRPSSSFPLISTSSMAQLFPESNIPRYDSINSFIPNTTTTTTASITPRRSYVDYLFGTTTASAAAADYYPATIEDEGMLRISRLNLDSAGSSSRPSNIPRRSKTSLGVYY